MAVLLLPKGNGHGPQFVYPEDFDAEDLAEYVTRATSD